MRTLKIFLIVQLISIYCFAQSDVYFAGGGVSYLMPIGSLAHRYKPTIGGSIYFGKSVSEKWSWYGKVEYFKFDKENTDKLFLTRSLTVRGVTNRYILPIPKLVMELSVVGITANANFKVLSSEVMEGNLTFGFGVYNWKDDRGEYYDSLYYTIPNDTTFLALYLNVPQKTLNDWSGGFNLGVDFSYQVFNPIWLNVSANYKAILGELWPTLSLDLENISTFQMFDARAGIKINF
jgi:hypothetical protein